MSNGAHADVDPVVRQGIKRIEAKLAEMETKLLQMEAVIANIYDEVS